MCNCLTNGSNRLMTRNNARKYPGGENMGTNPSDSCDVNVNHRLISTFLQPESISQVDVS